MKRMFFFGGGGGSMLSSFLFLCAVLAIVPRGVPGFNFGCPGLPCQCQGGFINCTCEEEERQNVTIGMLLDPEITSLEIHHCGHVVITFRAFANTRLESLVLNDLLELTVKPLAMIGAEHLRHLNISNVRDFKPLRHSFQHLEKLNDVFLVNLSSDSFPSGFLALKSIDFLILTDVVVRNVEKSAIIVDEASYFFVHDSHFGEIQEGAFLFRGEVQQAFFETNVFGKIEKNGFLFNAVHNLGFNNSRFDLIKAGFLKVGSTYGITFNENFFRNCESGAFGSLNESLSASEFTFSGNAFESIEKGCLPNSFELEESEKNILGNIFLCDCPLRWILEEEYRDYYRTGFCVIFLNNIAFHNGSIREGKCLQNPLKAPGGQEEEEEEEELPVVHGQMTEDEIGSKPVRNETHFPRGGETLNSEQNSIEKGRQQQQSPVAAQPSNASQRNRVGRGLVFILSCLTNLFI